jgi:hypothetical protein
MEASTAYERTCVCGRPIRGRRQRHRQIVSCSACGQKNFILPESPWPGRPTAARSAGPAVQTASSLLGLGRLLLVVVAGGLAAIGLLLLILKPYLRRATETGRQPTPAATLHAHIEAGQRALREGSFRLARNELSEAVALRNRTPDLLSRVEHRQLDQLHRQSDLLARLLDHSLEEILQQAMHQRDDAEWREKFEDYHGRTVLFDDVLRVTMGRPALGTYVVRRGGVEARVALEDLTLLRQLPLDPPQRWLFGAQLASCRREEGGVWVIRFEPDSAVLLTDEGAAAACCPGPMDGELQSVLRRQEESLPK